MPRALIVDSHHRILVASYDASARHQNKQEWIFPNAAKLNDCASVLAGAFGDGHSVSAKLSNLGRDLTAAVGDYGPTNKPSFIHPLGNGLAFVPIPSLPEEMRNLANLAVRHWTHKSDVPTQSVRRTG